jgi:hypothetical protein
MSQSSSSEKPYYLRYSEPKWYLDGLGLPTAEELANALFLEETVAAIAKAANRKGPVDIASLQADLRGVAGSFLVAARSTPLGIGGGSPNVSRTDRTRWLERQVESPTRQLLEALADENAALLSEWPERMRAPPPDRSILRAELAKLLERVGELHAQIEERKADGNEFATEFRLDLANALTSVFEKHFPDQRAARDGYDRTSERKSHFVEFLTNCVRESLPDEPGLPGHVIDAATRMRGNR